MDKKGTGLILFSGDEQGVSKFSLSPFCLFDTTAPIKLWTKVSDPTGSTQIDVSMKDTDGTTDVTLTGGSALKGDTAVGNEGNWKEHTITFNSATFDSTDAGKYITLIIKLSADQGDTADTGELTLKGNW